MKKAISTADDSMQEPKKLITVRDLTVGYDTVLLKGISFSLSVGDRILLDGPSGCGKTTVLRALLGLPAPMSGTIRIGDQPAEQATIWHLRRELGYVPQEPELGAESLMDFFERAFSFHANRSLRPGDNELGELMDRWLLPRPLLHKSCLDLSGGEKQRGAIILTILLRRKIILLDEPTSALDKECRQILQTWIRESGDRSFLIVSHDSPRRPPGWN